MAGMRAGSLMVGAASATAALLLSRRRPRLGSLRSGEACGREDGGARCVAGCRGDEEKLLCVAVFYGERDAIGGEREIWGREKRVAVTGKRSELVRQPRRRSKWVKV